jgi:hypothetical protein
MRKVIISLEPALTSGENVEVIVKVLAEQKGNKDDLKELHSIRVVFTPGSYAVGEHLTEDAIKRVALAAVKEAFC